MATVKIKNINNVKASVKELFDKVRKDNTLLTQIGIKLVTQTQDFNRAGKKPKDGKSHKPISDGWSKRKEKLKQFNKVSEYYRSGASNLTFTGQLLRAVKLKTNPNDGSVDVFVDGKREPYKNMQGKVTASAKRHTPTNDKLAEYLKDQGRPMFGVSRQIENTLVKIVRSFLNQKIRQSIFKSSKG